MKAIKVELPDGRIVEPYLINYQEGHIVYEKDGYGMVVGIKYCKLKTNNDTFNGTSKNGNTSKSS